MRKLVLLLIVLCFFLSAAEPTINFPTSKDDDYWLMQGINRWNADNDQARTTLAEDLDDSETGVDLTSVPSEWPTSCDVSRGCGFYIQVEKEYMYVDAWADADTATVVRGRLGSTASTHDSGDAVYFSVTASYHENVKDSVQEIEDAILNRTDQIDFTNGGLRCDIDGDGSCYDTNESTPDLKVEFLLFDQSTDQYADTLIVRVPDHFSESDGTTQLEIAWSAPSDTSLNVEWCVQCAYCSPSSGVCDWTNELTTSPDACSSTNFECAVDTRTANDLNIVSITSLTTSGKCDLDSVSAGDYLKFRVCRDVSTSSNMTDDAELQNFSFIYSIAVE